MSGPFQPFDDLGLDIDESLVCVDGVCAIPAPTPTDLDADTEPTDRSATT